MGMVKKGYGTNVEDENADVLRHSMSAPTMVRHSMSAITMVTLLSVIRTDICQHSSSAERLFLESST